jgi:hypothetical protein
MITSKKSNKEKSVEEAPDAKQDLKSEKPLSDKDEQDKAIRDSAPLQKQATEEWDRLQKNKQNQIS